MAVFRIGDLVGASLRAARAAGFTLALVDEESGETLYEQALKLSRQGLDQTAEMWAIGGRLHPQQSRVGRNVGQAE